VILTISIYLLALGGSALLRLKPTVLDAVPICLCGAALLRALRPNVVPGAVRLIEGIEAILLVIALGLSLACLSYVCAAMDFPLRDREMIWVDRQLGFDWLQVMRQLDKSPKVLLVLDGAYATFTFQLVATALLLLAVRGTHEFDCFVVTFVCASVLAELASVLIPTLGPMATLAGHSTFENLHTLGRTTADIVLALRQGTLKTIGFDSIDGIISFPSLHAAVAVIVPFALRWNRALFWPVLALNGVMMISAIPSGNHYLVDVIGGAGVAMLAIWFSRPLQRALSDLPSRVSRRASEKR
jgi:membrane-associated phospholipid phosphatase